MTKVAVRLLRALAEALGQSPDFFEPIYRDAPNQHVKIIRYPGSDAAANGQGVGAHKDSGFLTFVLQDAEEGLEIEAQDGNWIKADGFWCRHSRTGRWRNDVCRESPLVWPFQRLRVMKLDGADHRQQLS